MFLPLTTFSLYYNRHRKLPKFLIRLITGLTTSKVTFVGTYQFQLSYLLFIRLRRPDFSSFSIEPVFLHVVRVLPKSIEFIRFGNDEQYRFVDLPNNTMPKGSGNFNSRRHFEYLQSLHITVVTHFYEWPDLKLILFCLCGCFILLTVKHGIPLTLLMFHQGLNLKILK